MVRDHRQGYLSSRFTDTAPPSSILWVSLDLWTFGPLGDPPPNL